MVRVGFELNFKEDPIGSVINIIILLLILYILWQVYNAIKGHSWEPISILFSVVGMLIVNAIRVEYQRGKFEGKVEEFCNNIKEDLKEIKEKVK